MNNQYNFDENVFVQTPENAFSSNFEERNMPFANVNFTTNMMPNPNAGAGMMETTMNQNLAQPAEGYTQGNLFNNLYEGYKNYRPMRLIPNNEQAQMLLTANQFLFASHELRLYLDLNPNDNRMIALFNQYRSQANQAVSAYEQKYGPITWDALSSVNMFSWQSGSWPWEMGEM